MQQRTDSYIDNYDDTLDGIRVTLPHLSLFRIVWLIRIALKILGIRL